MKILTLLLILTPILHARTFTSSDGKKIEAEFIKLTGEKAQLKLDKNEKIVTVPLTRFSPEDQKWIKEEAYRNLPQIQVTGQYAGKITGKWELGTHKNLPYCIYGGQQLSGNRKYPLIVSLHRKTSNNANGKQITGFPSSFTKPARYEKNPCIILAPLCYQPHGATDHGWSQTPGEETISLITELVKKLPIIDKNRIYLVGYSMGGTGTWHLLAQHPNIFAAAIPVAGTADLATATALKTTPIWAFHGAKDNVIPPKTTQDFAAELKDSETFKYTEFPTSGHAISGKVYNDDHTHTWLFQQTNAK